MVTTQHQDRRDRREPAERVGRELHVLAGGEGAVEEISCVQDEVGAYLLDKRHEGIGSNLEVRPAIDHAECDPNVPV